jgi:TldD protein
VAQARTYARVKRRKVELGATPPMVTGTWATPVKRDPFTLSVAEKLDTMWALGEVISRLDLPLGVTAGGGMYVALRRQEKTFASTDGSFTTQTLHWIEPTFSISARKGRANTRHTYHRVGARAGGWEVMTEPALARDIPEVLELVIQSLDAEAVDPDRYDIVCDGFLTAEIVGRTIGMAAELDRVLGYEANAGGTSYMTPPEDVVGKLALAPAMLNVTADRSRPGGLATVKWDDEGVAPREYDVVRGGVLTAFHTTRELAGEGGGGRGRGVPSTGCAGCDTGVNAPLVVTPNLTMTPAPQQASLEDLVASLERGIVVLGGEVSTDRQQLNGEINPQIAYEVRNGKRTRFLRNLELLFRTPELWKGLRAIGGPRSQVSASLQTWKGQPAQVHRFSVSAVPARFNGVAATDRARQA